MIQPLIKTTLKLFRDSVFPVFCFGCQIEGEWLCQTCRRFAPPVPLQRCLGCAAVHPFGKLCPRGQKLLGLDYLVTRGIFHEWSWQDIVHAWKYKSATELNNLVKDFIKDCQDFFPPSVEAIIPVPLSRRRLTDRGFNQAEILSAAAAEILQVPVTLAISRVRDTTPQASLPIESRQHNVLDSFTCQDNLPIKGRDCLVVDDVVTTGATLRAMAETLLQAGARSVSGLTLLSGGVKVR
jgi:competence protein ComFC